MDSERKELYSDKINAGRRIYFFDVKESSNGIKYLVISESKKEGDEYKHDRVMIFENNIREFREHINKAFNYIEKNDFSGEYPK